MHTFVFVFYQSRAIDSYIYTDCFFSGLYDTVLFVLSNCAVSFQQLMAAFQ